MRGRGSKRDWLTYPDVARLKEGLVDLVLVVRGEGPKERLVDLP